jgi:glycosyltransferase involved in cell wall biosynthesis
MKKKLLVVTSTFPRWPNDTDPPFVFELCKRLKENYDITVHTPGFYGALAREEMQGIKVHRFRYFLHRFERLAGGQGIVPKLQRNKLYLVLLPFFLLAQCVSFFILVAKIRPSIIHAHWLIPQGLLAVTAKRLFGVPVVVTAHGADVFSMRQPVFIRLKKYIAKHANRVVTVSTSLAKLLMIDIGNDMSPEVISMGVDSNAFSPENKKSSIRKQYGIRGHFLLYVGRLTEKKGVHFLIDAMLEVVRQYPECRLLIIGHGEQEDELKNKVALLGLENTVFFSGGLPNDKLPPYYATADIFIGPSIQVRGGDSEGFGLTFVEAAMSGCLLIGTRAGGIEDIISDGHNGFLVPPADTKALAEQICQVINGFDSCKELKKRAREDAIERFDWRIIASKYDQLFAQFN